MIVNKLKGYVVKPGLAFPPPIDLLPIPQVTLNF